MFQREREDGNASVGLYILYYVFICTAFPDPGWPTLLLHTGSCGDSSDFQNSTLRRDWVQEERQGPQSVLPANPVGYSSSKAGVSVR